MKHLPGTLLFIGNLGAPAWLYPDVMSNEVFELVEGDIMIVISENTELNGESLCLTHHGPLYVHTEDLELCKGSEIVL